MRDLLSENNIFIGQRSVYDPEVQTTLLDAIKKSNTDPERLRREAMGGPPGMGGGGGGGPPPPGGNGGGAGGGGNGGGGGVNNMGLAGQGLQQRFYGGGGNNIGYAQARAPPQQGNSSGGVAEAMAQQARQRQETRNAAEAKPYQDQAARVAAAKAVAQAQSVMHEAQQKTPAETKAEQMADIMGMYGPPILEGTVDTPSQMQLNRAPPTNRDEDRQAGFKQSRLDGAPAARRRLQMGENQSARAEGIRKARGLGGASAMVDAQDALQVSPPAPAQAAAAAAASIPGFTPQPVPGGVGLAMDMTAPRHTNIRSGVGDDGGRRAPKVARQGISRISATPDVSGQPFTRRTQDKEGAMPGRGTQVASAGRQRRQGQNALRDAAQAKGRQEGKKTK